MICRALVLVLIIYHFWWIILSLNLIADIYKNSRCLALREACMFVLEEVTEMFRTLNFKCLKRSFQLIFVQVSFSRSNQSWKSNGIFRLEW